MVGLSRLRRNSLGHVKRWRSGFIGGSQREEENNMLTLEQKIKLIEKLDGCRGDIKAEARPGLTGPRTRRWEII